MNAKPVRSVREPLRKPRPLKSTTSSDQIKPHTSDPKEAVTQKTREEILEDLEILNVSVSNCSFDEITAMDISRMCAILKKRGEELDNYNKDAVDRYLCTLRNAVREERLDILSRVKLLETIELRAKNWKPNENITNYFFTKIQELEKGLDNYSGVVSPTIPGPVANQNLTSSIASLNHGEILKSSGKFDKPTKIAGKNYFKDEIVIRNSDSGKVMGIKGRRVHMIEELSETVISFQRVNPGARDRLVQITGPHEESIGHARLLVEDTIRRNASPIRELSDVSAFDSSRELEFDHSFSGIDNKHSKKSLQHSYSLSDASLRENHSITVPIGQDLITLTGTKLDVLKTASTVLKDFFDKQFELDQRLDNYSSLNRHSSPDNEMQRYQLRKQSSLKNNTDNNYSKSWQFNNNVSMGKRDSVSPFSSSDDDNYREEKDSSSGKMNYSLSSDSMSPLDSKFRSSLTHSSNEQTKISRSFSVPDATISSINVFPELYQSDEEVFSPIISSEDPPIPPPSYMKTSYNRDFLLKCAKSPFSHNQPADYAHIHQNFKEIICQSPVMFDPSKYGGIKNEEPSGVVF